MDETPGDSWGREIERVAAPNPSAYGGRRARQGGRYSAYVPPLIASRRITFGQDAEEALAAADAALGRLLKQAELVPGVAAIASAMLRSESVASSRIEGVDVSYQRLTRTADDPVGRRDEKVAEVLRNLDAMRTAIAIGRDAPRVGLTEILAIHQTLIGSATLRGEEYGGRIRTEQNWIGGQGSNPIGAAFVPPPPEDVPALLEDLEAFIARDDLPPLAQAAIAHAQFETIHPFLDGNGRTGRALVYGMLHRRGVLGDVVPPISLVLAKPQGRYIESLTAYRAVTTIPSPTDPIVEAFGWAAAAAADHASALSESVAALQGRWREQLATMRSDAAPRRLIEQLPASPVVSVKEVATALGVSLVTATTAIQAVQDRDILRPLNARKWGRRWEAWQVMDAVTDFESKLGDVPRPKVDRPVAAARPRHDAITPGARTRHHRRGC